MNNLKKSASVLSLVSAILSSIQAAGHIVFLLTASTFLSISSFSLFGYTSLLPYLYYSSSNLVKVAFFLSIVLFIMLIWISRHFSIKNSFPWIIFGLIFSIIFFSPVAIAAYICFIINNVNGDKAKRPSLKEEIRNLELKLKEEKLKQELNNINN